MPNRTCNPPVDASHVAIASAFAILFILAAIDPTNGGAFWVENAPVMMLVLVLVLSYCRFRFSTSSYLHILAFLALHELGAHFTYAKNPVGFWLSDVLGWSRNHYDRIVHFSFGLLIARPVYELFVRAVAVPRRSARWLVPVGILALAGGYELLEFWTAETVRPDVGAAFLGAQGDPWDAQQDMMVALLGASLWSALALAHRRGAKALPGVPPIARSMAPDPRVTSLRVTPGGTERAAVTARP